MEDFLTTKVLPILGVSVFLIMTVGLTLLVFGGIQDARKCKAETGFYDCNVKGKDQTVRVKQGLDL